MASLAAIIYVAHLGQAKSDAGSGYELAAITAVVLGGTSVFGGRGTIWGTLFGLFSISILQNGLRLAALPSEMSRRADRHRPDRHHRAGPPAWPRQDGSRLLSDEADTMKNSQLAVLCGAVLAGSLIVAATNVWLVHSLKPTARFRGAAGARPPPAIAP